MRATGLKVSTLFLSLILPATLTACSSSKIDTKSTTEQFNLYLDKKFDERAERSPQSKTYLGIKTDYDKLDTWSEERYSEELRLDELDLKDLKKNWSTFELDPTARLSYQLAERELNEAIEEYNYRH